MTALQTGIIQFTDPDTGRPLAGGYVSTLDTGLSPKATYSDIAETAPNQNPVRLDTSGSAFFFGTGSYVFDVYSSVGKKVRTIENIGLPQAGASVPDSETPELSIGENEGQFDGSDRAVIYNDDMSVKGSATVKDAVIAGAVAGGSVAGNIETVLEALSATDKPAGLRAFDTGPSDASLLSNRIYELREGGDSTTDPASDAGATQSGEGENWVDLMRLGTTEELRLKRGVMQWEDCKDVISAGTLRYPITVSGSDGRFYRTTGTPTADQIQSTDPVADTTHEVWAFVYDPTLTAQYPPWYRSPNTGVDYNTVTSVAIPAQAQKLLDGVSGFVDDGESEETFYKSTASWEYGAGSSGTPKGGAGSGSTFSADGAYETYMIKTLTGEVDFVHIGGLITISAALLYINSLGSETTAGREWYAYRRVGSWIIDGGAGDLLEWQRAGREYFIVDAADDHTISGNLDTDYVMRCPALMMVRGSLIVSVPSSRDEFPKVKILGYNQVGAGYTGDFTVYSHGEHDVDYRSAGGFEFVRQVDASREINIEITDADATSEVDFIVKTIAYIDPLTD